MSKFYLVDEKHQTSTGGVADRKGVLYFEFTEGAYNGHATLKHVQDHPKEYTLFKQANPDYKSPWGDDPAGVSPDLAVGLMESKPVAKEDQEIIPERSETIVPEHKAPELKGVKNESIPSHKSEVKAVG